MFTILIPALLFLLHPSDSSAAEKPAERWSEVCATADSVVMDGDLVFLDIPNFLFRRVAQATQSWTSHIGVAFKNPDGNWIVSEGAVAFSRETPLCDFLKRSSKYKFEIRRLHRPLEANQIKTMRMTANSLLGIAYDLGFNFDSSRMFCSKFAYLVYQSIGVEVGQIQSFHELIAENSKSSLTFWKFWFFGKIPSDRRTVTPASQLRDTKFITVLKGD